MSGSKALWANERHHEIDAERERDRQAKDHFEHGRTSDSGDQTRVKREDAEGEKSHGEEDDVRH